MDFELDVATQSSAADVPPSALVGRRRNSSRALSGAIEVRPMSNDAEVLFKAVLQRVVANMVENHLRDHIGGDHD